MIDSIGALLARAAIWIIGLRTVYVECERTYAGAAAREGIVLAVTEQGGGGKPSGDDDHRPRAIGFFSPGHGNTEETDDDMEG